MNRLRKKEAGQKLGILSILWISCLWRSNALVDLVIALPFEIPTMLGYLFFPTILIIFPLHDRRQASLSDRAAYCSGTLWCRLCALETDENSKKVSFAFSADSKTYFVERSRTKSNTTSLVKLWTTYMEGCSLFEIISIIAVLSTI